MKTKVISIIATMIFYFLLLTFLTWNSPLNLVQDIDLTIWENLGHGFVGVMTLLTPMLLCILTIRWLLK